MHQNNRITQIEGARRGLRDITNVSGANGHPQTKVSSNQLVGKSKSSDVPSLPPTSSLGDSSEATSYNRREADDIDARDANNPLMVTNYVQDIYAHMRQKEIASISTTYMQRQPHINEKMRAILIDWLVGTRKPSKKNIIRRINSLSKNSKTWPIFNTSREFCFVARARITD